MERLTTARALLFVAILALSVPPVTAQTFDPFDQDGAEFSADVMAMLWLGLEQGVVESCNGDVSRNAQKFLDFANAAGDKFGDSYSEMLAGIFGEGLRLGSGIGCDIDAMRNYRSWSELYYDPAIARLLQ
jgi:hypothetical protein